MLLNGLGRYSYQPHTRNQATKAERSHLALNTHLLAVGSRASLIISLICLFHKLSLVVNPFQAPSPNPHLPPGHWGQKTDKTGMVPAFMDLIN